jgi:NADH:ubiquinone oxidoreductase subunit 5 (subunit L)/multisubunit Na+/H+ antiporter MnhA subunit
MSDDPGYQRFFAYIALFTFAMLMLVMANNFLQLFFGWEAVGVVSYLLIGFWYTRPSAIFANLKAFLVNRVGDFGFLLGIAGVLYYTGSLDYGPPSSRRCRLRRRPVAGTAVARSSRPSGSACSSGRWASPRRFPCTSGCRTRWKVRRPSRP